MAWNEPGNNGQNNNPWGNNNKKPNNNDFLSKLIDYINKIISGSHKQSHGDLPFKPRFIIIAVIVIMAIIWFINGFHTINQSERGVVTRFGKVESTLAQPGLNWYPPLIDKVYTVDVKGTYAFNVDELIVTADEKLVSVEMNIQYKIKNPVEYLFNVTDPDNSLRQAADSALRTIVGGVSLNSLLSESTNDVQTRTQGELNSIIEPYHMGIEIIALNFKRIAAPQEVMESILDVERAKKDQESLITKGGAYKIENLNIAKGQADVITEKAKAYQIEVESRARGEVGAFKKLLPEYIASPQITKTRLYLDMMQKVMQSTNKVLIKDNGAVPLLNLAEYTKSGTKKTRNTNAAKNNNVERVDIKNIIDTNKTY